MKIKIQQSAAVFHVKPVKASASSRYPASERLAHTSLPVWTIACIEFFKQTADKRCEKGRITVYWTKAVEGFYQGGVCTKLDWDYCIIKKFTREYDVFSGAPLYCSDMMPVSGLPAFQFKGASIMKWYGKCIISVISMNVSYVNTVRFVNQFKYFIFKIVKIHFLPYRTNVSYTSILLLNTDY